MPEGRGHIWSAISARNRCLPRGEVLPRSAQQCSRAPPQSDDRNKAAAAGAACLRAQRQQPSWGSTEGGPAPGRPRTKAPHRSPPEGLPQELCNKARPNVVQLVRLVTRARGGARRGQRNSEHPLHRRGRRMGETRAPALKVGAHNRASVPGGRGTRRPNELSAPPPDRIHGFKALVPTTNTVQESGGLSTLPAEQYPPYDERGR